MIKTIGIKLLSMVGSNLLNEEEKNIVAEIKKTYDNEEILSRVQVIAIEDLHSKIEER
jgi:hypothetical protein